MTYLTVRNWDKWQSYRHDRQQPPWIKLHRCLLRNAEWIALTDAQRAHLISIWMLAADKNGRIPDDAAVVRKMCCLDNDPDLNLFIELGFLDARVTPRRRQYMTPERRQADARVTHQIREEADTDTEKIRKKDIALPRGRALSLDWQPTTDDLSWATRKGFTPSFVEDCTENLKLWAEANRNRAVARKADWSKTWKGWLCREWPKHQRQNGTGPPRQSRTNEAADRRIEKLEREQNAGHSRPSLRLEGGEDAPRQLSKPTA